MQLKTGVLGAMKKYFVRSESGVFSERSVIAGEGNRLRKSFCDCGRGKLHYEKVSAIAGEGNCITKEFKRLRARELDSLPDDPDAADKSARSAAITSSFAKRKRGSARLHSSISIGWLTIQRSICSRRFFQRFL
jgi:hypothetical protein